jgi:hypothetical protein
VGDDARMRRVRTSGPSHRISGALWAHYWTVVRCCIRKDDAQLSTYLLVIVSVTILYSKEYLSPRIQEKVAHHHLHGRVPYNCRVRLGTYHHYVDKPLLGYVQWRLE